VAGHVHRQFQPAPDAEFVEDAPQMVLDDLLTGADDATNLSIGKAIPDENAIWISLGVRRSRGVMTVPPLY